jgi:hypothetical protein
VSPSVASPEKPVSARDIDESAGADVASVLGQQSRPGLQISQSGIIASGQRLEDPPHTVGLKRFSDRLAHVLPVSRIGLLPFRTKDSDRVFTAIRDQFGRMHGIEHRLLGTANPAIEPPQSDTECDVRRLPDVQGLARYRRKQTASPGFDIARFGIDCHDHDHCGVAEPRADILSTESENDAAIDLKIQRFRIGESESIATPDPIVEMQADQCQRLSFRIGKESAESEFRLLQEVAAGHPHVRVGIENVRAMKFSVHAIGSCGSFVTSQSVPASMVRCTMRGERSDRYKARHVPLSTQTVSETDSPRRMRAAQSSGASALRDRAGVRTLDCR